MKNIFLIIFFSIFYYQCETSKFSRGWNLIADQDYQNALSYFHKQLESDPNNYEFNFGVGLAYYFNKNYDEAIKFLKTAKEIKPLNSEVLYHLGLCCESINNNSEALRYYNYYLDNKVDSKYKTKMELRYVNAIKLKYQIEAKEIVSKEKDNKGSIEDGTLAIINFDNRSNNPKYDPLIIGLPIMFITDFGIVPQLKLVERLRLQSILDELQLNKTDKLEEGTLQIAGKLLGAKNIIKGSFTISDNNIILDIASINTNDGSVNHPMSKKAELNSFYRIEKELVLDMVDKLGIIISDDTRRKILTLPTEGFFEFLERMKNLKDLEKMGLPSASNAMEVSFISPILQTNIVNRLNSLDINTGGEKIIQRTEVPSRFLPDPPLPPK